MDKPRLNRLFHPRSGRAFDVAVDHGAFHESRFISGIEDMGRTIQTLIDAGPDAIQLTVGQAKLLQSVPGKQKPALVLRTDIANVYNNPLESSLHSLHFPDAIEIAVRLDAVAVCVNLLDIPDHPEIREQCIRSIMALRSEAERYGMPLMIEPLVMRTAPGTGGYGVDGNVTKIVTLVRQARELGADLIKADPTTNIEDYHRVIEVAGDTPVLVRGGGRVNDHELLTRTRAVLDQGARGIVYGRNVIQHQNPAGITAALMAVVHEDASVFDALPLVGGSR